MDELVDIINEQNSVVGQVLKQEAHARGLLHRTIISEVINSTGEWLLVKQAADRQDAGQFVSPVGGHVRAGESEVEALLRETKEELGIDVIEYKRVGQKVFNRFVNGHQENHLFILYEIYSDADPVLNHESVAYQRLPAASLNQALTDHPADFGEAFHFVRKTFY